MTGHPRDHGDAVSRHPRDREGAVSRHPRDREGAVSRHPRDRERAVSRHPRDRAIDAARAYAIVGVVAGHWLVTGLVPGPDGLRTASPLAAMPALAPATWVLQTLGLFFFAGGYAAVRSRSRAPAGRSGPPRPGGAGRRLVLPVLALLGAWALVLFVGAALGVSATTLGTIGGLVVGPLWFLLPYLALRAATGPLSAVVARLGAVTALPPIAVVAAADLGLLPGTVAVPAAWAVPWLLGMSLAARRPGSGASGIDQSCVSARGNGCLGALLALGGGAALAALVVFAGYPASAVGVPGGGRSNLSPPSLAAVALAVSQIGVFLMVRAPLARVLARDRYWRPVAALNRVAVPVYLRHQSVLLAVAGAASLADPAVPGLLTAPTRAGWVIDRVAWLPVLALVLAFVAGERRHGDPGYFKRGLRGTLFDGSTSPDLPTEVIAVRDSDPPSRGRAARQPL